MWEWIDRKRDELGDTLWLVPSICTVVAVILAFGLVRLDESADLGDRATSSPWLFGGGAEGARGVLSAIAGTMIAVAATVFSITILTLQLASSQFTPRVLRHFTGDRGVQLVLGVFIGTFTYALMVMRSVHSEAEDRVRFVPVVSVSVGVLLALVAIGMLIYQIHHVARMIQAAVVVDRAARETIEEIGKLDHPRGGSGDGRTSIADPGAWPSAMEAGTWVAADRGGYVMAVDVDGLLSWAAEHDAAIRVAPARGSFVTPGEKMLLVVPARELSEKDQEVLRGAVALGLERTMRGDPAFGVRQLSDIAIKALSPGINDPTTAQACIDRLGEVVARAAASGSVGDRTHLRDGVRLHVAGTGFDELVGIAFAQIRHYGAADATVMRHLVATLGTVAGLVDPGLHGALAREAGLAVESAREKIAIPEDVARIEAAAAWATALNR